MKLILSKVLLFCYLISISGWSVVVHYCGGSFHSIYFGPEKTLLCTCGAKPMKPSCCKNHSIQFKIKDLHAASGSAHFQKVQVLSLPTIVSLRFISSYTIPLKKKPLARAPDPPPMNVGSIYLRDGVLLI